MAFLSYVVEFTPKRTLKCMLVYGVCILMLMTIQSEELKSESAAVVRSMVSTTENGNVVNASATNLELHKDGVPRSEKNEIPPAEEQKGDMTSKEEISNKQSIPKNRKLGLPERSVTIAAAAKPCKSKKYYTVKQGDTCAMIVSKSYQKSMILFQKTAGPFNCQSGVLVPGMQFCLP